MLQSLRATAGVVGTAEQHGTRLAPVPFRSDACKPRHRRRLMTCNSFHERRCDGPAAAGQLLTGLFAGAALVCGSAAVPLPALAETTAPAEPTVQQQPALVTPAQQGPIAPSVTEAAAAPPVSDSAPQQPAAPPGGAAAQQPGVRTPAAESLRSEVDALLKQPPPAIPPSAAAPPASPDAQNSAAKQSVEAQQAATKEDATKVKGRKKGRIRELEEIRSELAEKELVLLGKEKQLLDKDQTVAVLREELEIERKLRALLTKDKQKAEEEAALAVGLCRSVP